MIAKVQYDDFKGTAAADISDYYLNSINEFLKKKYPSFDWQRYYCVGCELYTSYGQYPSIYFICHDSADGKHYLLQPQKEYSLEEFFELFKRFSVVIGESIEDVEPSDKTIMLSES